MSFTAQPEAQVEKKPLPANGSDIDTTTLVKVKYEAVKENGEPKLLLTRQYQPINQIFFDSLKSKLIELTINLKEGDNPAIEDFIPVIFGVLEGSSGLVDPMLILTEQFGSGIENLKIQDMIKERTKIINYGVDKRKGMSVCEVDKKTLDAMNGMYDLKEIRAHRKTCLGVRNYIKSWRKFKTSFESNEDMSFTSPAYKNYVDFIQQELTFNNLKIVAPSSSPEKMIDEADKIVEKQMTPLKEKRESNKKDDTASTHKNKGGQNVQDEKDENKQTRVRRTKQEIQRDRLLKEQEKEEKKRQKEEKERQKQLEKEKEKEEKAEKQRQKQLEKEQQLKAKQEQKQAKQRDKQLEKEAKQKERLEKEAERRKKEQEKERQKKKKSNVGQSLLAFFKPKGQSHEDSHSRTDKMDEEKSMHSDEKHHETPVDEEIIKLIREQSLPINDCREDFFMNKMRDENSKFEPYYVNIVTHKSRLEFTNFLVTEERFRDYTSPHQETQMGKYDDSSVEYEDLCGDVCNEDVDVMSAEEEEAEEENSAIVPDSYFEDGELSQESKDDVVVNIGQGGQWHFHSKDDSRGDNYQMFCLFEETFPLALSEPEQTNEMTLTMRCQLYKEIHGYHGTKEALVKDLVAICDKVPKSYLFGMIRETTTKKGHQRLIKPELIDFMNEQKEGFAQELQEIKLKRDEQIKNISREKVNQKEKELERLILEEAGTYYIVDLLQFLKREKGYRITKKDLIAFIDTRVGSEWDDVRKRMKKMQVKQKEKMTKFLKKDKEKEQSQEQEEPKGETEEAKVEPEGDKMIAQ